MELYLYSRDAELIGVTDTFYSLRWRRKYFEPGEFELHLPATAENIKDYTPGRILHRIERKECGIIEGVTVSKDLTVTGRMLSALIGDAIISKTYNFNGSVEQAMRTIVNQEVGRIHSDIVPEASNGYPETLEAQVTYKNALDTIVKFSKSSNIGFGVSFDALGQRLVFYTRKGIDRSVQQADNPRVFFNDEFQNLLNPTYTNSISGYKNFAFVGGEGEGSDRVVATVDQTGGETRRELWVDAKDIRQEEMSLEEYTEKLKQHGKEKLAELSPVSCFEGEGITVENFEYLIDWDLGDIVTVGQEKWGVSENKRITEVEEIYENGIVRVIPVFGTPLPEVLKLEG